MKIIHIVHGKANPDGHNGISLVVYNMNKYEKLQGVDSRIWSIVDGTNSHYTKIGDSYVSVECYPRVWTPFGKHEILEDLRKEQGTIDLVHFHLIWFYDKNIIAKELKKLGIPFILTTHGTYLSPHAYTGKRLFAKNMYEKQFLNMATEIHTITREEGTGLQKFGYKGKSFVAYNGVDLDILPKHRRKDFFSDKKYKTKIKLLWVGVLRKDKNIEGLIRAISLLPHEIRNTFVCVLVGPDYKNNSKKYITLSKELNCQDNIDYIGPLYGQEKYDAIESADAYIMPSLTEVFSLAILDAMACAKPCLITSGCGYNYLETKKINVVCEPYPQDIARGLEELLSIKELWGIMGKEAQQLVQKELNWEAITSIMIKNYKRIIDQIKWDHHDN